MEKKGADDSKPLDEIEAAAGITVVPEVEAAPAYVPPTFSMPMSDDEDDDDMPRFCNRPLPVASTPQSPPLSATTSSSLIRKQPAAHAARLFTADELAILPEGLLDRQRQKQLAKKAKKKRMAAGQTENELMAGFLDMGVDENLHAGIDVPPAARPTKKELRKEKKKAQRVEKPAPRMEVDPEAKREADFASFLQQVGDDDMDEEL